MARCPTCARYVSLRSPVEISLSSPDSSSSLLKLDERLNEVVHSKFLVRIVVRVQLDFNTTVADTSDIVPVITVTHERNDRLFEQQLFW